MDTLIADFRLAVRQIRSRPAISGVAVLALAIGLGINTVAFSTVNAFLFRPRAGFDVPGAGRVIVDGVSGDGLSVFEYARLQDGTSGALETAVEGRTALAWTRRGSSETVWALLVAPAYFDILETKPLAGRLLNRADGAEMPAVISERFWRDRLGSDRLDSIRLTLNGVDVAVVGVLPDSFEGPGGLYAPEVWLPFDERRAFHLSGRLEQDTERWLAMIGRLQPGVSIAEVDARLQAAAAAVARERPASHARWTARFSLMRDRVPEVRTLAWFAAAGMAAVGLVLLLACFNVANLLLARAVERQREVAIRAALGASRWRIFRQHATEGAVLGLLAALAAAVVALWSQRLVGAFAVPIASPQRLNVSPDLRVVAFIVVSAIVAGVLPAIAPAVHAVRLNLIRSLSAHGAFGSGGRLSAGRKALMLLQVIGSTAFLAVAALMVQSFAWIGAANPGFETERAVVMTLDAGSQGYDAQRARLTIDRALERFRQTPGVEGAAIATELPLYIGYPRLTEVAETAQPCAAGGCPKVDTYGVSAGYFAAMNVAMVRGREFSPAPAPGTAVVNETFAERWFAGVDPVGRIVRLGNDGEPRVVIGVARNTVQRSFSERPTPALYLPLDPSDYESRLTLVVRTAANPGPFVPLAAAAVREIDPALVPESLMTMRERLELPRWPMKAASMFFGGCGAMALILATIGLVAVMTHAVNQRMREFGVRLAVGASSGRLVRDVAVSGLALVAPGVAGGLIAAMLLARTLRAWLVGVDVASPATYLAIAALQAAIALLAFIVPARRAAHADPLVALRSE